LLSDHGIELAVVGIVKKDGQVSVHVIVERIDLILGHAVSDRLYIRGKWLLQRIHQPVGIADKLRGVIFADGIGVMDVDNEPLAKTGGLHQLIDARHVLVHRHDLVNVLVEAQARCEEERTQEQQYDDGEKGELMATG